MKAFYRNIVTIGIFLTVMLTIVGTASADVGTASIGNTENFTIIGATHASIDTSNFTYNILEDDIISIIKPVNLSTSSE